MGNSGGLALPLARTKGGAVFFFDSWSAVSRTVASSVLANLALVLLLSISCKVWPSSEIEDRATPPRLQPVARRRSSTLRPGC